MTLCNIIVAMVGATRQQTISVSLFASSINTKDHCSEKEVEKTSLPVLPTCQMIPHDCGFLGTALN